ncbi:hypothetical protein [Roseimaritima ulvae]|uniref:Uncharacterized protein n=2 Tax=Roseimaritima ulvae TaxID=980254 RepID=A0A5B9QJ03_9BACT|nr:hypothetical protein [Roseimaritima ulvae]QEG38884.1 hypothetical protein UC8_08420 [Roseimaritima ulvae]
MHLNLNDDQTIEGPSETQIRESLATLEVDAFAILSRGDEQYVQVYHNEDGSFQLEYRAGSYDQHFAAAQPPAIEDVQDAFVAYAAADARDPWPASPSWEKMEFDADFEGDV